jgi:hypothetical protein
MSYPSLEQYNEVFQHPRTALSDPALKSGSVATTGLGLPLALCGGFALTYTLNSGTAKFAVRCFHKQSNSLEKRYSSISSRLKTLRSPYFVDFEFQPLGVTVYGKQYPIVKMAWAKGTTLGEFLEQKHKVPNDLRNLLSSLRDLSSYLESQNIAHGDISPDNVMVSDGGKKIQLIDYDGMYVDDLRALGSAELGNRNFQHPKRVSANYDQTLDRFSFIQLSLAIQVLIDNATLWRTTQSDASAIIFRANDCADPSASSIFLDLFQKQQLSQDAKNFASICKSPFDKIPSLEDFLLKKNIPQVSISLVRQPPSAIAQYLSAFPVLDAKDYSYCLGYVGDKVELIGLIVEVKHDNARNGKPYVFINFGPWKGEIVKVSIWSEGLEALAETPSSSWVGKWISVVGLMEPPYVSRKYKYSHLAISITQANQIHVITEKEARYRLAGSTTRGTGGKSREGNQGILDAIKGVPSPTNRKHTPAAPVSSNQSILDGIKRGRGVSTAPITQKQGRPQQGSHQYRPQQKSASSSNCFIATAVYGHDATETNMLRHWRDRVLLPSAIGRLLVGGYYQISPHLIPLIQKKPKLKQQLKVILDWLISRINK